MSKSNIISLNKAAQVVGVTLKTLQQWIDEDGAPCIERGKKGVAGKIDTVELVKWMVAREAGDEENPYFKAKLGKLQEEERRYQLMNDIQTGKLYPAEDVDACFSEALVTFRAEIEGAAGRIAGGNRVLRQKLLNEFRSILNNIADKLSKYMGKPKAETSATKTAA